MHGAGANDDTSLSFVIQSVYTIYRRAPRRVTNQVNSYILAHPNTTRTDDCLNRKKERKNTNEPSASAHAGYIVLVGLGWYLPTTEKLVITTQHMDLGQAATLLYVGHRPNCDIPPIRSKVSK